jgi:6-phosphofructokinase 1
MTMSKVRAIGVLTSGGDAPGMNAAVRAVVRMALHHGVPVYGIHNGWQGAVEGGEAIEPMNWWSVGGILQKGGTVLGTARSQEFRTREGRLKAAVNLYRHGIDGLVVIGGDGSLTGARILAEEWPDLLREAAKAGRLELPPDAHPTLAVVGLPGSIDNDTYGTDMSIGADTALHRIVEAADQLVSTASAHQRTFVLEVMGRNCGYLALAGGLASGAHWIIIPEEELKPRWHQEMVASLRRGREAGRKHAIVIQAEGARHPDGLPLSAATVSDILTKQLGAETRVTVLGHVQRGGSPSAYDRILATRLGAAAVEDLMAHGADLPPRFLGIVNNEVHSTPLVEMVEKSQAVGKCIEAGDYETALALRGPSFQDQLALLRLLTEVAPKEDTHAGTILVVTAGHDAPGMNACVRVVTRVARDHGYRVLGAQYGLEGLLRGDLVELEWMTVSGWAARGGSELGSGRYLLQPGDLDRLAAVLQHHAVTAMILIGGMDAYQNAEVMAAHYRRYPALHIPVLVVPASINNNLPGTDFAIGADTALNNIIAAIDKVKDTAGANKRAYVVEVMGYDCGYLALMAALASGAEQVYLPEEGVTLQRLAADAERLRRDFQAGKRLAILIYNERASPAYTTEMIRRILDAEGGNLFDVRAVTLGHVQRGGSPSPFDRILAARLGKAAVEALLSARNQVGFRTIGLRGKHIVTTDLSEALAEIAWPAERPHQEWFMALRDLTRIL